MTGIQRETRRMGLLVERPAAARAARPGAPARGPPRRSRRRSPARRSTPRTRWSPAARSRSSAPRPSPSRAMPERLRQVVDNLLANVRAHTPADAAAIVRVRREGASAVLEVEDRGAGSRRRAGRARLRALLPRRSVALARPRRRGPRARDRGRDRRGARRQRRGREHAGRRDDVPRHAARPAACSGATRFHPAQRSVILPSAIRKITIAESSTRRPVGG